MDFIGQKNSNCPDLSSCAKISLVKLDVELPESLANLFGSLPTVEKERSTPR